MELMVNSITHKYKEKLALDNVDAQFTPGIWALLGANGAGKTTLMQILTGIMPPTKGNIQLNGVKIEDCDIEYRSLLGYLPQKFGYYEDLTVSGLKGISRTKANKRISELLEVLNIPLTKKTKMHKLSGGMRQRVGIAQTMLNDPQIIILDEPTAGLDIEERRRFREYIAQESRNKIVLISTHIVSDIEFISNYVMMINSGKIIDNGNTETLAQKLEGKVWEAIIDNSRLETVKSQVLLTEYHQMLEEKMSIRYVSERKVIIDSHPATPRLSDYYLFMNQKELE